MFLKIVMGLLFAANIAVAQQAQITLLDKISNQPISFANVSIEGIGSLALSNKGYQTDLKGKAVMDISKPVKLQVTYIGYKNLADTIAPGENKTLFMEPTVYNMDEVVVTGQFAPETVDKSIYRIKVLGSLDINQKAAINLHDVLQSELNIRTTNDNVLGSNIIMQGLQGENVKFLIDGVPVIGRQNGNIDLNQMTLQNVDHVEIIQGPMSVVYGSNALAGVINIITKDYVNQNYVVNADAYYESVGVYNFSVIGSYTVKKSNFTLSAGRNFFDGYDTEDYDVIRQLKWKPKLQYNAEAGYIYKTAKSKIRLSAAYFYEKIQDKGDPHDFYIDTLIIAKSNDIYYYTKRLTFRGEGTWKLSDNMNLNVLSAYSIYNRKRNTYLKDMSTLDQVLDQDVTKQDTTDFNNFLLRADIARWTKNEIFKYQLGIDFNVETGYGKKIKDNRQQIGDYAAFLSLNYTPVSVLSIQPGIRYIYNTEYKAPLVYSVNAKWDATDMLSFRVSLAKGFRAPSLKELYLDFVDVNHNILGNDNLKAETSLNINFSSIYSSKRAAQYNWGLELNLFYNDIFNKIELAVINPLENYYTYLNVNEYITQGYEFSFNNRIYPWLQLKLGVATTGRKLIDTSAYYQPGFIYSTDFTAQGTFYWKKPDLNFAVFYKYNGAYPETYVSGPDEVPEQVVMSAYNSLDVNVSRWFWKRRVNVQVGGKNLFNNTNIASTGNASGGGVHSGGNGDGTVAVNWGRTFFVHLVFNFTK